MYKLDPMSTTPLYQQIVDRIREAISLGHLVQGDQLPSIREMAKLLVVNTSTVTRAYKEMENAGMIQAIVGKGTFISFDTSKLSFERKKMEEKIKRLIEDALIMGFTKEQLLEIVEGIEEEEGNEIGS